MKLLSSLTCVLILCITISHVDCKVVLVKAHLSEGNTSNVVNIEEEILIEDEQQKQTNNERPIIGILTQDLTRSMKRVLKGRNYSTYIAASYVKFIESAGARVVPVFADQSEEYYKKLIKSLNGFLYPGGGVPITSKSKYGRLGQKIYDMSVESWRNGRPIPLYGTCLGFELLGYLVAGNQMPLESCRASNRADTLDFTFEMESSRMFSEAPQEILEDLSTKNITANFHIKCIFPQKFYDLNLNKSMIILSTTKDDFGKEYISTFEHRSMPLYGTQWHPEKAPFEWSTYKKRNKIPHSPESIKAAQYMANFYVNEARKNNNSFATEKEEKSFLIYNYNPIYLDPVYETSFQQCYFFDK